MRGRRGGGAAGRGGGAVPTFSVNNKEVISFLLNLEVGQVHFLEHLFVEDIRERQAAQTQILRRTYPRRRVVFHRRAIDMIDIGSHRTYPQIGIGIVVVKRRYIGMQFITGFPPTIQNFP